MTIEEQQAQIRDSQLRAVRAVRRALTILLDAHDDIVDCFAGDQGGDPDVENERVKAWNALRPLLLASAKGLGVFAKAATLGAECILDAIDSSEALLQTLEDERIARKSKPFLEKLRACTHPLGSKEYELLRLNARMSFLGDPRELPPELRSRAETDGLGSPER